MKTLPINIRKPRIADAIVVMAFAAITLCFPSVIFAATYYVDPGSGSDSNPGTTGAPWRTTAKAQASVANGDTVLLRAGDYGDVSFNRTGLNRNSWSDGVVYQAENADQRPVFRWTSITGAENRYITLKNIDFIVNDNSKDAVLLIKDSSHVKIVDCNTARPYPPADPTCQRGVWIEGKNAPIRDILIQGCDVKGGSGGILAYRDVGGIIIKNNNVHMLSASIISLESPNNGNVLVEGNHLYDRRKYAGSHGSGISVRMCNVTIRGNIIHDFGGSGAIKFYDDTGEPPNGYSNMLIENNLFYDSVGTTNCVFDELNKNITVRNNTFVGAHYDGCSGANWYGTAAGFDAKYPDVGVQNLKVYNNIFVGTANFKSSLKQYEEDNNIFFSFKDSGSYLADSPGSNSIVIRGPSGFNPGYDENYFEQSGVFFVGSALFDQYSYTRDSDNHSHKQNLNDAYKLADGSDGIGFADPAHTPATDLLGLARDAHPDAGCYEYGASDPAPPATNHKPVADAGADQQLTLTQPGGTIAVTLDASNSFDQDGDALTYLWTWTQDDSPQQRSGKIATVELGEGQYTITLTVNDGTADSDPDYVTITIYPVPSAGVSIPAVQSLTAGSNQVELLFSSELDANEANKIGNYAITAAGQAVSPSSFSVDSSYSRVTIYTTSHQQDVPYDITISNIADSGGNTMPTTTLSYLYDDSLVGLWQFHRDTSGQTYDSSGRGNTATPNGPVWTKRSFGGAMSFDGVDDYVDCGNDSSLNITGSLTIAGWIYPRSFGQSGWGRIVDKGSGTASRGFSLLVNETNSNLEYVIYGGTVVASNANTVTLNTWQYVAVVYDESSATVTFYVNGEQVGSSPYDAAPADSAPDALVIGRRGYDGLRAFDGLIDDVRIYNRALAPDEIEEISMELCPIGDKQIKKGSDLKFEVITLDSDIPVTIANHNLPSEPNFSSNIFEWTPSNNDVGTYNVTFEAVHGAFTDQETIVITVKSDAESTLSDGLVGYWKMDDSFDTPVVEDSSTLARAAVAKQNTSAITTTGVVGGALSFNGTSDYIFIPGMNDFNNAARPFTISMWIKPAELKARPYQMFMDKLDETWPINGWSFGAWGQTGKISFTMYSDPDSWLQLYGSTALPDNVWSFVAVTYDGSKNAAGVKLYVNGAAETPSIFHDNLYKDDMSNRIFAQLGAGEGARYPFKGSMDNVAIFDRMLFPDEIAALYNSAEGAEIAVKVPHSILSEKLVGYWRLNDDSNDTVVEDDSGNSIDGTATQTTNTLSTEGKTGGALTFNGIDDYIDLPGLNSFDSAAVPMTIAMWIKPADLTGTAYQMFFDKFDETRPVKGFTFGAWGQTGKISFTMFSSVNSWMQLFGSTVLPDDVWSFVAVTYDGSKNAGGVTLYVNGVAETPNIARDMLTTDDISNPIDAQIGAREGTHYPFKGSIDNVMVFERALSKSEVDALYNTGQGIELLTGLLGQWKMNDCAANGSVADSSGNGIDANAQKDTSLLSTTGKSGHALTFNGVDDYVLIPNFNEFDSAAVPMTIAMWVKPAELTATPYQMFFDKFDETRPVKGFTFGAWGQTGKISFTMFSSMKSWMQLSGSTVLPDDVWSFVAVTYDGSKTAGGVTLYVNGVAETPNIARDTLSTDDISNSIDAQIGAREGAHYPFQGVIDDVMIFHRALSPGEIHTLYGLAGM